MNDGEIKQLVDNLTREDMDAICNSYLDRKVRPHAERFPTTFKIALYQILKEKARCIPQSS